MSVVTGPKLSLLYNANINEQYFDQLRIFLQSLDQLIMGSVINSSTIVPPSNPNPGDSYLLTGGAPSGAWTGQAGNIAVWDAQLTNSGTNTIVPGWIFLSPNAGWTLWNVAAASFTVFNGSSWVAVGGGGGGANFPVNTDITSMTGIPNTTISTTGYAFNDGTSPPTTIGEVTTGGAGPNGFQWGTGTFSAPTSAGTVIIGDGPWTGLAASGAGVGVRSTGGGGTAMTGAGLQTTGTIQGNTVEALSTMISLGALSVGGSGIVANAPNTTLVIAGLGMSTVGRPAIQFNAATASPTNGVGLIGFAANYFTQTTVGAAGSASALPGAPKKYIQIVDTDGAVVVFPVWASV